MNIPEVNEKVKNGNRDHNIELSLWIYGEGT